jgi:hypothetical protein
VGYALWSCTVVLDVWLECNVSIQKSCNEDDAFCNILLKLFNRLTMEDYDRVACLARQIWLRQSKMVFQGGVYSPKKGFPHSH